MSYAETLATGVFIWGAFLNQDKWEDGAIGLSINLVIIFLLVIFACAIFDCLVNKAKYGNNFDKWQKYLTKGL